ncbi:hypothetical protein DL98DRAFT_569521 [Cadophora sp. DSE1049]|nr:hypothetical protein DL98DRAFT_569521 [Cadophora sp. DSE1049]
MTIERPATLSAFVPTLWRVFVYFAEYPWMENMPTGAEQRRSHHHHIDEQRFILAYNLLPLRGVELLGSIEKSWAAKHPRLTSLMFNSLGNFCAEEEEHSEGLNSADWIETVEKQLGGRNHSHATRAVYFSCFSWRRPKASGQKAASDRLALSRKGSSLALSTLDLQTLLQLILLLRIDNAPWRRGLIYYMDVKRCGDIERPFFVHGGEEVLYSARLAKALIQHRLGDAHFVSWKSFEAFYSTYPNILLRFYELWTSICLANPLGSPTTELDHLLSNSIVQSLSLIGPVDLDSLVPGGSPFNEDERQLRLDMQNAIQVASSASIPTPDVGKLVERPNKAELFHIIVVSTTGESQEQGIAGPGSIDTSERLFTLFTSTAGKEIMFEGTPGCTNYSWRYGSVQLLPQISTSRTGGPTAGFLDDNTFKLFPHNQSDSGSRHQPANFTFDIKNGTVVVDETGGPLPA